MKILISGSLAYDRIMTFPGKFADHILPEKIHVLSVSFMVSGLTELYGGTAGNIAFSLALLGERPMILAAAGKDFDRYADRLLDLGVSVEGIRRIEDEFTGGAYITTDMDDCQITGFNPGAMSHASLFNLDGVDPAKALAIVAPGNVEDMLAYPRLYREKGVRYIFDPGQQLPVISGEDLAEALTGAEILISNDYELEKISQMTGLDKAGLLARVEVIITTLGEHGALISTSEGDRPVPAAKVGQVKDPTGAGDAFRSGLIKGLTMGLSLDLATRVGAVCAAYAVEKQGTQEHTFTEAQFWARYEKNYGPPTK